MPFKQMWITLDTEPTQLERRVIDKMLYQHLGLVPSERNGEGDTAWASSEPSDTGFVIWQASFEVAK